MKTITRRQFTSWLRNIAALSLFTPKGLDFALAKSIKGETRNKNFSEPQWAVIGQIADIIIPKSDFNPSATEAGILVYLDRAFGDKLPRWKALFNSSKQGMVKSTGHSRYIPYYHKLVGRLDSKARSIFKKDFLSLTDEQQVELIQKFSEGSKSAVGYRVTGTPSLKKISDSDLLSMVRRHVLEGYFADPIHGGNKNYLGWEAIHNTCNMNYPKEKTCPPHAI